MDSRIMNKLYVSIKLYILYFMFCFFITYGLCEVFQIRPLTSFPLICFFGAIMEVFFAVFILLPFTKSDQFSEFEQRIEIRRMQDLRTNRDWVVYNTHTQKNSHSAMLLSCNNLYLTRCTFFFCCCCCCVKKKSCDGMW